MLFFRYLSPLKISYTVAMLVLLMKIIFLGAVARIGVL